MKKLLLTLSIAVAATTVSAQQWMRVWQAGESTRYALTEAESMEYATAGSTITIGSQQYATAEIDSITIVNPVTIIWDGASATVEIPANVEGVSYTVDGGNVVINNANITTEQEFVLTGTSANGSLTYNGAFKATFRLNGLTLTSQRGAALDILCGKRCAFVLEDGTTNTLADYEAGEQKACLYCKGHVEMEGGGTLNVTGNYAHAIKTKEYLQLKKSTGVINILKSAGDAIHVGQYYRQNGGTVNVTSTTANDGIQVDVCTLDDDIPPDPDKELNGRVTITGGILNLEVTDEDQKCIKCDSLVTITGGTLNFKASGNGCRGIQTNGDMIIGEKDGDTSTPSITIAATGGLCTKGVHSDDPHRCMGMNIDGNLTVYAGTTVVTNTGAKSRGIKVGGTYSKKGGVVTASIKN